MIHSIRREKKNQFVLECLFLHVIILIQIYPRLYEIYETFEILLENL